MEPFPTIHTQKALNRLSTLQTPSTSRKLPKVKMLKIDEIQEFAKRNKITTFDDLNASHAPSRYNCNKTNDTTKQKTKMTPFYEIIYDEESEFPRVEKSIKIHKTLSVHLQFRGNDIPLPQWLISGRDGKLF